MRDTLVVIPVKNPRGAKARLAKILTPNQRREFALALFQGVLDSFKSVETPHEILVVTDSDEIAVIARANGAIILREKKGRGETEAVDLATQWAIAHNFRTQVVVPGDMAWIDPADLRRLLAPAGPGPRVVLSPATGDDGTNAILTAPPDVLPFRFGKSSFPDYRRRAKELSVPCRVLRLRSFVLDVDTPEDLAEFVRKAPRSPARTLLVKWGVATKSVGRS